MLAYRLLSSELQLLSWRALARLPSGKENWMTFEPRFPTSDKWMWVRAKEINPRNQQLFHDLNALADMPHATSCSCCNIGVYIIYSYVALVQVGSYSEFFYLNVKADP